MKYTNVLLNDRICLCVEHNGKWFDASELATMKEVVSGKTVEYSDSLKVVDNPILANLSDESAKLLCVGLNYKAHADNVDLKTAPCPILFSKFSNALAPGNADVELPEWETSYDYEAELVIVIGKTAWNVSEQEAMDYVFGFTAGNDFSLREAQMRTSQWLIGKTMPGFGPCGPCIVTKDEFGLDAGKRVQSYVNGELRQDGNTSDMIFSCREIISYASKYIKLEPGDLIFTGTPSGVQLEKKEKCWLKRGDRIDVVIEDIGTLTNTMV